MIESEAAHHGLSLVTPLVFLGAAVLAVPLFRLFKLGAVIGYLAAGVAVGPSGLRLIDDPTSVLTLAELGVVLLLFINGLELKPSRLRAMRRDNWNTVCSPGTPLSANVPSALAVSAGRSAATSREQTATLPVLLLIISRRLTRLTVGPTTVKSRRSGLPMLP